MALDLSALDGDADKKPVKGKGDPLGTGAGKPLDIPLEDIEEDPDQPRKEYSKKALDDMAASIKEKGVKQPISVRPHPEKSGFWIINFGSRRYRGSKLAKKKTIPAFVDEKSDDYDQVIENDQRENLTAMEMAIFIQKKMEQGEQQKDIAQKLGRPKSIVTEHLALIDPPDCVLDAYRTGKCTSPRTLYELRQLHKKHPEKVEDWYKSQEEVTRKSVSHLAEELKGKKGGSVRHDELNPVGESKELDSGEETGGGMSPEKEPATKEPASPVPPASGALPASSQEGAEGTLINPVLSVVFEGRNATVLLNKKPSEIGMIGILFEEGGEAEVEAAHCQILHLIEA